MSLAMNAQQIETPFAYPQAPDTLSTLEERTSYVVMKFWDNCDFKKVMPDTAKFNRAFRDYISFVPKHPSGAMKCSLCLPVQSLPIKR